MVLEVIIDTTNMMKKQKQENNKKYNFILSMYNLIGLSRRSWDRAPLGVLNLILDKNSKVFSHVLSDK